MWRSLILVAAIGLAMELVAASFAAAPDTKAMVLKLSDLPAGFSLKKGYYSDNADSAKESKTASLADYARWGRITGYEADYVREGIAGILELDSSSSTYKSVKGARDSLRDSFLAATKSQRFNGVPVVFKRTSAGGQIGHEARMYSTAIKSGGVSLSLVVVIWRYGPVKASTFAGGLRGTVDAADVAALAKKQQARIAAALR